jgi:hypothetical protein
MVWTNIHGFYFPIFLVELSKACDNIAVFCNKECFATNSLFIAPRLENSRPGLKLILGIMALANLFDGSNMDTPN